MKKLSFEEALRITIAGTENQKVKEALEENFELIVKVLGDEQSRKTE